MKTEESLSKVCRICGEEKPLSEFRTRTDSGKRRTECRNCLAKQSKKWREANPERVSLLNKQYRETHRDELNSYSKKYQSAHLVEFRKYNKKYRENMTDEQRRRQNERQRILVQRWKENPEYIEKRKVWSRESSKRRRKRITAYEKERKKHDSVFKLKKQIRGEIRHSFNRRGFVKSEHTEDIVGCTLDFLYDHLCITYRLRYGREYNENEEVHIDHIIPLANARTREEVIRLCHWTNLQLLTPEDNLAKNADESFPEYMNYIKQ